MVRRSRRLRQSEWRSRKMGSPLPWHSRTKEWALVACLMTLSFPLAAQTKPAPPATQPIAPGTSSGSPATTVPTHINPEQAKELFSSVDGILTFDSEDTGLPVLHSVKRQLVTRDEVEQYLKQQL